ncbi:sodium-coupled monocarboxylate transporter 1-like [Ixodes scapularis]
MPNRTPTSSMRHSRPLLLALLLNIPGVALLLLLSVLSGLILFAVYGKCDPRLKGDITRADQLMPYIVQDLLGDYPGLCGVLVAAVYSGCLSSLSSGFNAMAAVTWDDFIRPCVRLPEKRTVLLTKCIAAGYGLLSIAIAFVSGTFKSLVQVSHQAR